MKNLNYLFSLKTLVYFFLFVVKNEQYFVLQFIYSEKATKFCEILTFLPYAQTVKSKTKILQNFVAFSEYMNCNQALKFEILKGKWTTTFEEDYHMYLGE